MFRSETWERVRDCERPGDSPLCAIESFRLWSEAIVEVLYIEAVRPVVATGEMLSSRLTSPRRLSIVL